MSIPSAPSPLEIVTLLCNKFICNPPILHAFADVSKAVLDKSFDVSPSDNNLNNLSSQSMGDANSDFRCHDISSCKDITIVGENIYISGEIKLGSTLILKASKTIVICGKIVNNNVITAHCNEFFALQGLQNSCMYLS